MSPVVGSAPADQAAWPVPAAPSALRLRWRLRSARRQHGEGPAGDLYVALLVILICGAVVPRFLDRQLAAQLSTPAAAATRWWLMVAVAVAAVGLAWQLLRAFGPLLAMPSTRTWCLASPVDRRGWLAVPLAYLLLGGAAAGAALGATGALLAGDSAAGTLGGTAVLFAGAGVALAGFAAAAQTGRRHPAERVPALLGLAAAAVIVGLRQTGLGLDAAALPVWWSALVAVLVAVVAVVVAVRRLGRVDRAALADGVPLAGAAFTAVIFMDPRLFSGVLEARRERRMGRVRRGGLRLRPGPRWAVLLWADLRRLPRRPQALWIWAGLLVVPYALTLVAPHLAGTGRLLAGYLAANRLATGLRTVCRSPALCRAVGGTDRGLRLVHLVVPGVGVLLWWLAGSGVAAPRPNQLVFVVGLVLAVYRNATTSSRKYGGGAADTPFGQIPFDLLRQLLRGLDVVAVLAYLQLVLPA